MDEENAVHRAAEAPDFIIEDDVGAMLNTNARALAAYRLQRATARKNRELSARVDRIESTLGDIKELLLQALTK